MSHLTRYQKVMVSPHDPTLVLAGSTDLRLYQYATQGGVDKKPKLSLSAINTDINQIKCMDWSLDPSNPSIVAIGQTNGKVNLVRIQPIDPRLTSGSTHTNMTSSGLYFSLQHTLSPRSNRPCNVIAFHPTQPGWMACGFDKVRNEVSLLIYDVTNQSQFHSHLGYDDDIQTKSDTDGIGLDWFIRKESSQTNSVSHTPSYSPVLKPIETTFEDTIPTNSNYAGSIRSIPNHRIRNGWGRSMDDQPIRQQVSSEAVVSLAWAKSDPNLIVAGLGLKRIKLFDLNQSNMSSGTIISTKSIYNLTFDPFDQYQFLSTNDEGVVSVWDQRKPTLPILTFDPQYKSNHLSISYCPNRRGRILTCFKEDRVVKAWDTLNLTEGDKEDEVTGVVWSLKNSLPATRPLSSFAVTSHSILAMTRDSNFEHLTIPQSVPIGFNNLDQLGLAFPAQLSQLCFGSDPDGQDQLDNTFKNLNLNSNGRRKRSGPLPIHLNQTNTSILAHNKLLSAQKSKRPLSSPYPNKELLASDIKPIVASPMAITFQPSAQQLNNPEKFNSLTLMRSRATQSYGLDLKSDIAQVESDRELGDTLSYLHRTLQLFRANATRIEGSDLAFHSIITILNPGQPSRANLLRKGSQSSTSVPRALGGQDQNKEGGYGSVSLKKFPSERPGVGIGGGRLVRKRLALAMVNPYVVESGEDEESVIKRFERSGNYEQAARASLILVGLDRAIKVLNDSPVEKHQLIATTLYHSITDTTPDPSYSEQLLKMSHTIDDIGLKVLYVYAYKSNWSDLVNGDLLTVAEKAYIIIKHSTTTLADQLAALQSQLSSISRLECLILIGLSDPVKVVTILQTYLDRTGDLQTVSLIYNIAKPFFKGGGYHNQFEQTGLNWTDTYRSLLDSWSFFKLRCQMDIATNNHCRAVTNQLGVGDKRAQIPSQISVKCTFCNSNIGPLGGIIGTKMKRANSVSPAGGYQNSTGGVVVGQQGQSHKAICCPTCKKPLPRCALCLLHLGSPASQGAYPLAISSTVPQPTPASTPNPNQVNDPSTRNSLDHWFAWCQTCRHGGHYRHLQTWFDSHPTCPVTDCPCPCPTL